MKLKKNSKSINMDKVKVSVVVAIYNGEKTLPRCLDSILNQTYPDIEIICVNDCSQDNSLQILNEYQSKYSQIRVINHESNKHGGGSGNTGIKNAIGDYVCIVDQDDTLYPYSIENLVKNSHNGHDDIVLGQWCIVDEKGNKVPQKNGIIGNDIDANIKHTLMNGVRILGGLFKPSLYKDNDLYYPEHVNFADNAIYNAILIAAQSISVIGDYVYDYAIDTVGSSSKNMSLLSIQQRVITTNMCFENCTRVDKDNKYTEYIKYRYLYLSRNTIEMLLTLPYKDAISVSREISKRISSIGDNMYYKTCTHESKIMLTDPIGCIRKYKRYRNRRKIHTIIHKTVVLCKKAMGMDPTKSIFSK